MSEKAPGTPWKAITLSAAAGAFLLASDITCKLSPSRVRRRPGQRQDLGCEASVGQRRRGRESALSGCQQSPCPLQVGGSIDTQREGVNAGHIDPHAGLQSAELLQPLAQLERRGRQRDEAFQRLAAVGVDADVMVERLARESGGASCRERGLQTV